MNKKKKPVSFHKKGLISLVVLLGLVLPLAVKGSGYLTLKAEEAQTESSEREKKEIEDSEVTNEKVSFSLPDKEAKGAGSIYFKEVRAVEVLTGDEDSYGMDDNDEPGYDSSVTNDIVRSYDRVFYTYSFSMDASDGQSYSDIELLIKGNVQNGVTKDGRMLNASFSELYGGGFDLSKKESTISYTMKSGENGDSITTGSNRIITLPLEVYGAANGTELDTELTVQVISAKDHLGNIVDLKDQNIITEIPSLKTVKVSSKVNMVALSGSASTGAYYEFDSYAGTTGSDARLRFAGTSIGIAPIEGRGTGNFLGSAFPDTSQPVTLKVGQEIRRAPTTGGVWSAPLPLTGIGDTSSRPMEVFAYGRNQTKFTGNVLGASYPNKMDLIDSVTVPYAINGNVLNSVTNTGNITMKDNGDTTFNLSYSDYIINNVFPDRPVGHSAPNLNYQNGKFFLASAYNVFIPMDALKESTQLQFKLNYQEITYTEDNVEKTQKLATGGNTFNEVAYPKGTIMAYSEFNQPNGQPLGTNVNAAIPVNGNSSTYKGAKIIARSATTIRTAHAYGGVRQIQKWNPGFLELDRGRSIGVLGGSGLDGTVSKSTEGYGVSKDGDYSLATLNNNTYESYDWYPTYNEAITHGTVSAYVKDFTSAIRAGGDTHILLPMIVTGDTGTVEKDGSPHAILVQSNVYFSADRKTYSSSPFEENKNNVYYKLTEYPPNSTYINHNPAGYYGDTLLILDYKLGLSKSAVRNKTDLTKVTQYNSSDIATYMLQPVVEADSSGASMIKVKIKDTLPKGMTYVPDSATQNGNPIDTVVSEPNSKGETDIYWELEVMPGTDVGKILYQVQFNQSDLSFNPSGVASLTNTAVISSEAVNNSSDDSRTANYSVNVIKEKMWNITKTVDKANIEANNITTPIQYTLRLSNQTGSDIRNAKILDVLPNNGDELGSSFKGNYRLVDLKVLGNDGKTENPNAKSYYTNSVIDRSINPNAIESSSNWDDWDQYTGGKLNANARAIYVNIPEFKNEEMMYVQVSIQPVNNQPGDIYLNRASGNSENIDSVINSSIQQTAVVNRKIQGKAWFDDNYNGGIDPSEEFIEDIPVSLYSVDAANKLTKVEKNLKGKSFVDAAGNSTVLTDDEGEYLFDALAAGDYVVGFGVKPEVDAGTLFITKYSAPGINSSLNSKVSLTETEGADYLTPISKKYTLPKIEEISTPNYVVDYVNMGVLKEPSLTITKGVYDKADETTRKDINGGTVKVGDTLHYELVVKNPNAHSIVEDVLVKDTIPEGLAYKAGTLTVKKNTDEQTSLPDTSFVGRELTAPAGDLIGPDDTIVVGFDVEVTKEASGTLKNVATVTGTMIAGENKKTSNEVKDLVPPLPALTKTVDVSDAKLGDELTYSITVSNQTGGGKWLGVQVTDVLESYFEYVPNSTTLEKVALKDSENWSGNKLTVGVGDLAEKETKVITFKVRLVSIPDSFTLVNKTNAVGKDGDGKNFSPPEAKVETPTQYVKLNLRQVILKEQKELVVPTNGYFELVNKKAINDPTPLTNYQLITDSTTKDQSSEITQALFTTRLLHLKDKESGLQINDIVPEYYRYVGHIQTTDGKQLSTEHLSSQLPADASEIVPFLDYTTHKEYWVTVYLEPKLGTSVTDEPEPSPRPYSWDYRRNEFGQLTP